jgi:hypothetical protein
MSLIIPAGVAGAVAAALLTVATMAAPAAPPKTLSMAAEIAVNCPHHELRLRTQSPAALEALGRFLQDRDVEAFVQAHPVSEQDKARALVKECLGPEVPST